MVYIDCESDINKLIKGKLKKVKYVYKRILKKIILKKIKKGIIIFFPEKNIKKYQKSLLKWIQENNIKELCISNKLNNENNMKNKLYGENINILDGRWLINYMVWDIIKFILYKTNKKIEKTEISIMTNENQDYIIETIKHIAPKFKVLNIITEEPQKFYRLEQELYDIYGVIINISNNYKKSLLKSEIVINFNIVEEKINEYIFKNNTILVNLQEKIEIYSKNFSGININYIDIYMENEEYIEELENFNKVILYESFIKRKDTFSNIRKIIETDKIKIKNLIGNNGIITQTDYTQVQS